MVEHSPQILASEGKATKIKETDVHVFEDSQAMT